MIFIILFDLISNSTTSENLSDKDVKMLYYIGIIELILEVMFLLIYLAHRLSISP
jgi:hypothetical protein